MEFADLSDPFCAEGSRTVRKLLEEFGKDIRFIFRQNPSSSDEGAVRAAQAAVCAHEQGRYWEYRQELFKNQGRFSQETLVEHAAAVGLDVQRFGGCQASKRAAEAVSKDIEVAKRLALDGSPEFVVNGIRISGAAPFKHFARLVRAERDKVSL